MTFYSYPTVRHNTQHDILQRSYHTLYTIWHSTVILLYIIHNMAFYSDPTVLRYTQHDILQWSYCTTLYTIWHSTVILLYYVIQNMTFYSDPTVLRYTEYDILQWSYCRTLYTMRCCQRPWVINKQKTNLHFSQNSAYPKTRQNKEVRGISQNKIYVVLTSLKQKKK